ncbi:hypothetical protein GCM10011360_31080 [Primorskyibacter flagellatus]|uniref:Gcp-like domain-containing protein n=1 Tax=Primorskyibacter flagellatus TaxID=1387277 RepID=A0A917ACF9_9RHOB|nr:tRNA (adenosine(37)-N6)-threonylcarbamoyltransferase complex dimerization subunit type 1 TsaB [Primorskyibacter flagellatus]GGE41381.1 hypothetical protein GCM10011360_31080 [Primorskyibacter flagellatus]
MLTLGFDTSAGHCAAALLSGDVIQGARAEEMTKGQAEALFPLLEALLSDAGRTWADLDRIGVGIGPGNFTGIRIAVSAARGLALSLDIPAIGVSTFDVIAQTAPDRPAAVPAPRGMIYLRTTPGADPQLVAAETAPGVALPPPPADWAAAIARHAAGTTPGASPAPLYLRPADAAPARDAPPDIVADAAQS